MIQNKFRTIGWAFCIVVLVAGAALGIAAVDAQDGSDSATIEYNYTSESVEYELEENPYPYRLDLVQATDWRSYGGDDMSTFNWEQNGTKLYFSTLSGSEYVVDQWDVSEPYSLDPSDYSNHKSKSFHYDNDDFEAKNIWRWGNDGNNIYISGDFGSITVLNASTPYDITTVDSTGVSYSMPTDFSTTGVLTSFAFIENGNRLLLGTGDGLILTLSLSEPWDLSSFTHDETIDYQDDRIDDMRVVDNEHVFLQHSPMSKYTLSTPGDYSTQSLVSQKEIYTYRMDISHDGKYVFTIAAPASSQPTGDLIKWNTNVRNIWLEDSNNNVLDGTEETVTENTGSIPYQFDTYDRIQLQWESASDESLSGTSNEISVYGDGQIDIREEQTHNLITQSVNVTAYGDESGIYTFDTSDGSINIGGLPDQAYTFVASSNGYVSRNKYTENLGNIDTLYLLSNQTERVTSQFLLEDTTNTFNSESRLIIERSIPLNGNDWETIYSDSFGTEGVTVELQEDIRYRISLENDEIRRTIGPYRATISESVTIRPESGEIEIESEGSWFAGASYDNDNINVRFHDPTDTVDSVSITVHERGNESNTLAVDDEYVNPTDLRVEYAVPPEYNESNWQVEIVVEHNGESTTIGFMVGPTLDTVPADLDPLWRNVISVIIVLTFGLGFSVINRAVGALVLAAVGGLLWWIGWLAGATAGVLITAYMFIAVAYAIYEKTVR